MKAILGRKMGMTQVFADDGTMYAVTVVEVLPNVVTQVKTKDHDGYDAIQIGYEDKKENRATKAVLGVDKKAGISAKKVHAELRADEMMNYKVGDAITADKVFSNGDRVDVIGTSKGHGYAGTIKRWHMTIGPKGHGSGYHRGQGSFANNGRYNHGVMPGKHMSGHMGVKSATILNLVIVAVNAEKNYILVKGAIPGPKRSIVTIRSAVKTLHGTPVTVKPVIDRTPAPVVNETPVVEEVKVEAPVTEAPAENAAPATEEAK